MSHWNLKRATRLGHLAGRGLSVELIMADDVVAEAGMRVGSRAARRCRRPPGPPTMWSRLLAEPVAIRKATGVGTGPQLLSRDSLI